MAFCEDEDCGDESPRRTLCFHCGLYVCGWCWNHIHGCGPGHEKADCKSLKAYKKFGRQWINKLRARLEVLAAQNGDKTGTGGHGIEITKMLLAAEREGATTSSAA